MTRYQTESYEWIIQKILSLEHELDILRDIRDKLLESRKSINIRE